MRKTDVVVGEIYEGDPAHSVRTEYRSNLRIGILGPSETREKKGYSYYVGTPMFPAVVERHVSSWDDLDHNNGDELLFVWVEARCLSEPYTQYEEREEQRRKEREENQRARDAEEAEARELCELVTHLTGDEWGARTKWDRRTGWTITIEVEALRSLIEQAETGIVVGAV